MEVLKIKALSPGFLNRRGLGNFGVIPRFPKPARFRKPGHFLIPPWVGRDYPELYTLIGISTEEKAGDMMSIFIKQYIKPPIAAMESILQPTPLDLSLRWTENQILIMAVENYYQLNRKIN
jgi:hypothetical protein